MSWLSPPPVVIVSGDEHYLAYREIRKAVAGASRTGRFVEWIDATEQRKLLKLLASGSVLFKGRSLVVVRDADRIDPAPILKHHQRKSSKVALVLYLEGVPKKKGNLLKIASEIPKKHHLQFKAVPPWKQEEFAAGFLVREANQIGIRLSEKLAKVLVAAAGTELGILSFELKKLHALLRSLEAEKPEKQRVEKPEVQTSHLRQTLSTLTQVGAIPVVDALAAANEARLARALSSMRRTHTGDPTMKACALLARNVTQWVHAAGLLRQGAEVQEISVRLQLHPYICKTKVLPVAKKWGEENLAGLLTVLAEIERGVKSGHVNSWVELECLLLKAIRHRSMGVQ